MDLLCHEGILNSLDDICNAYLYYTPIGPILWGNRQEFSPAKIIVSSANGEIKNGELLYDTNNLPFPPLFPGETDVYYSINIDPNWNIPNNIDVNIDTYKLIPFWEIENQKEILSVCVGVNPNRHLFLSPGDIGKTIILNCYGLKIDNSIPFPSVTKYLNEEWILNNGIILNEIPLVLIGTTKLKVVGVK